ncbi:MAG: hypothetical protein MUF15_00680 [Acidobacteria bacterium]|jgi:hypothetical protein|nr:hypothetical protein [Acidobacteriota bacterium]
MKKIILLPAVILAAVILLVQGGCKDKAFNITGTWDILITIDGVDFNEIYSFVGDRVSGDLYWEGQLLGFYTVSGDQVHFQLEYYDADDDYTVEDFRGYIDTNDQMSGNVTYTVEGYNPVTGTWIAAR